MRRGTLDYLILDLRVTSVITSLPPVCECITIECTVTLNGLGDVYELCEYSVEAYIVSQ